MNENTLVKNIIVFVQIKWVLIWCSKMASNQDWLNNQSVLREKIGVPYYANVDACLRTKMLAHA